MRASGQKQQAWHAGVRATHALSELRTQPWCLQAARSANLCAAQQRVQLLPRKLLDERLLEAPNRPILQGGEPDVLTRVQGCRRGSGRAEQGRVMPHTS